MEEPIGVLYLEPVGERGGAQNLTLSLSLSLDRTRFRPVLACLSPGSLVEEASRHGVPAHSYRAHRFRELWHTAGAIAWIRRLVRRYEARIIHVGGTKALAYAAPAGRLSGARILWHLFDPPPTPPSWIDRVARLMPRDREVCISEMTRRGWQPLLGHPPELVEPGIDPAEYEDLPPRPPGFRCAQSGPHLVMVSRLQRFKGHTVLLDALPEVIRSYPSVKVHLVGGSLFGLEPGYREELDRRISHPDLAGHVELTGFVSDRELRSLVAHCDILVHPALQEPFGLVLLEAMAWSRPVVAARSEGPARIIDSPESGILVEPGSSTELAQAILQLLDDPDRAKVTGRNARLRVEEQFQLRDMVCRIQEIYNQLIAKV